MDSWLIGSVIGVSFVLPVGFLIWVTASIIDDHIQNKYRKQFSVDLRGALQHSQPSWDQIVEIAQSRNLSQRTAFHVVQNLLRDVLTGADREIAPHRPLLEAYVAQYKVAEPFEGLPSETRVHLERLREALGDPRLLDPLTGQIKELVSVYEKGKSRQRLYTVWGFVLGIVGLLFAAYAYFFPYAAAAEAHASRNSPAGSAASAAN